MVLVPFYRGAVVFDGIIITVVAAANGSRPLLSRSGCIWCEWYDEEGYSIDGSRPLLSRSGCI